MNTQHTSPPRTLFGFRWRTLVLLMALALLGVIALGLDLAFEGLIYDHFYATTGETEPLEQLLGYGQYLVRWTREQPDTDPYADMPNANVNPFGVNTFFDLEAEPAKREQQAQMIHDAGFTWMRQQFRWEDIEIHGKDDFEDRRNDYDDDQIPDPVSAWLKYDNIVDIAEQYDLRIMARLSDPPAWSQAEGVTNTHMPPADYQDFADFAAAVAERYAGRIYHYQVWNEPNLYPEWGDQTVNAEAYTDMLCRAYAALKAVDPDIVVITGALGPTVDLSGRNAYDLLYLQRMYQAGAGDCFDVLSVQGYGLWSGPTDQRLRQVTVNFQRHLWLRDMMVANGDAHKPIWISEAGWNPVPNDPTLDALDRYGRVTMDEAADFAPQAYARAIEEWPWIGGTFWWYFKRPNENEINQSWYYFRLVEPDFTTTPVYDALKAYMSDPEPKLLGAGRHGVLRGDPQITPTDDGVQYHLRFEGTGVYACPAPDVDLVRATIDGTTQHSATPNTNGCTLLADDLDPGTHELMIVVPQSGDLESFIVIDHAARNRLPWLLTGLWAAVFAVIVLGAGIVGRFGRK
ncbi:MAG: hypothetical protein K8S97_13195 [Anaerolineae bacterium]|nr:hypothetical protein [Anaerolineae bacterium]